MSDRDGGNPNKPNRRGFQFPRVDPGGNVPGANQILDAGIAGKGVNQNISKVRAIELPKHSYVPEGSESVFVGGIAFTNPTGGQSGGLYNIFNYTAGGSLVRFTHYRLWVSTMVFLPNTVGPVIPSYEFIPTIDQGRVIQNHGIYNGSYFQLSPFIPNLVRGQVAMNTTSGFDQGCDTDWVSAQVILNPNKTISWNATGGLGGQRYMGVWMYGYIDTSIERPNSPPTG